MDILCIWIWDLRPTLCLSLIHIMRTGRAGCEVHYAACDAYASVAREPEGVSGSCRCALIGVPCRLRMLSIVSTLTTC